MAVNKGAISITQANITDLRLDKNLCGIVHGTVDQIDVTTLFNQYSTRFKIKSEKFEKEFEDWLKTLKDVLGEDTAGNLLNLITKNTESINNIKSDLADITTEHNESTEQMNTSIEEIEKKIENYNSYASSKDGNGIYTIVEYKDKSNQLYMKSTLSSPDSNGNYKYDTWQFYKSGSVISTIKWTMTYDEDSNIVSKVVA